MNISAGELLTEQKTWVITGGAGFIGKHLARELVRLGQKVRIFDNFSAGGRDGLEGLPGGVQVVEGDILEPASLLPVFEGADYVLHHAALVSVPRSVSHPLPTLQTNIQGTANVLHAARQCGVKRVVFASSCAIYGNGETLPYREDSPRDILSPYALSKQAGMDLCDFYTRTYGLETVSLVYFNVFGTGQNPDSPYAAVIAKFMRLAKQKQPLSIEWDGLQSRDFVHVRDVVQANLLAALKARPAQSYNVAFGRDYSMLELADLIEKISGRTLTRRFLPKRPGDSRRSRADISKIKQLGFRPAVSLEEGLKELWNASI